MNDSTVQPTPEEWMRLGDEIAKARVPAGYRSASALARAVGIDVSTLYAIEAGRKKKGGDGPPASEQMYLAVTTKIGWRPDEWKRRVGLLPAELGVADLVLTPERQESLRSALRNIRKSADEAIKVLGG